MFHGLDINDIRTYTAMSKKTNDQIILEHILKDKKSEFETEINEAEFLRYIQPLKF